MDNFNFKTQTVGGGTFSYVNSVIDFNDSVKQVLAAQINNETDSWELTYTGKRGPMVAMLAMLRANANTTPMLWVNPLKEKAYYLASNIKFKFEATDVLTVSFTFTKHPFSIYIPVDTSTDPITPIGMATGYFQLALSTVAPLVNGVAQETELVSLSNFYGNSIYGTTVTYPDNYIHILTFDAETDFSYTATCMSASGTNYYQGYIDAPLANMGSMLISGQFWNDMVLHAALPPEPLSPFNSLVSPEFSDGDWRYGIEIGAVSHTADVAVVASTRYNYDTSVTTIQFHKFKNGVRTIYNVDFAYEPGYPVLGVEGDIIYLCFFNANDSFNAQFVTYDTATETLSEPVFLTDWKNVGHFNYTGCVIKDGVLVVAGTGDSPEYPDTTMQVCIVDANGLHQIVLPITTVKGYYTEQYEGVICRGDVNAYVSINNEIFKIDLTNYTATSHRVLNCPQNAYLEALRVSKDELTMFGVLYDLYLD